MTKTLKRTRFELLAVLLVALVRYSRADSIEIQNNPVQNGTIHVAAGDADRTDWEGIPWFEPDDDFDEFFPVDIEQVQFAHDSFNLYVHLRTLAWEVNEGWRVGMYLNTDEDPTTGYHGSFLAVGADVLVEDGASYEFTGVGQAVWGWSRTAELARDQSVMTDVEVAIPLSALRHPTFIDFVLFANNNCCDFGLPDDIYPNGGATLGGDYFTYEVSPVVLTGDFNFNSSLDAEDINILSTASAGGAHPATLDLNGDAQVDAVDLQVWIKDLNHSWVGDANLDGEFNSSDLVVVLASGSYEMPVTSTWTSGDFNGDGFTTSGDLVAALTDGGYEVGPRAVVAAVPEPSGCGLLLGVLLPIVLSRGRRI